MAARSRADVERLLLEGARAGNHIPRLGPEEAAPLSFAQERMWLLDRMLSNVTVYNVPRLLRVRGRVDEAALRSALDVVASRHAAIRTGISLVDDTLVQRVYDDREIELEVHDLRDSQEAPAEADRLVAEFAWSTLEPRDGQFDFDWLGLPSERYGFSNDAHPIFSEPDFSRTKFRLSAGANMITVHLQ